MDHPLVAVVLAGGTGTRLYPATRSDRPKQFLSFDGDRSLLAETVGRVAFADERYVLTREAFAEGVRERAPEVGVLTEPAPKDTGPALAYATHRIREQVGDCVVLAIPSDHRIAGDFQAVAERAARAAVETEGVAAVGIEPTRPETGYGYVEPGERYDGYRAVDRFHEKPDEATAREYVDRGFLWNAGTFAWTPDAFLREARAGPLEGVVEGLEAGDPDGAFAAVDPVSVDYAVMERSDDVYVVPADLDWDDLGAWDAVARHLPADEDGNAALGDALPVDAAGNVVATDGHVSLVGVENLVVASYGDRTLVVPREDAQRVREVVSRLREDDLF